MTCGQLRCLAILTLMIVVSPGAIALGQEGNPIRVKIAVIDVSGIRRSAAAVKDIGRQIQEYQTALGGEIRVEEEELRNATQELNRQRAILAPEVFAEERRKFEARVISVQRKVQQGKQAINKVLNEAMRKVQDALNSVIVELARENQLTLVLRKDQTVLVATALEITKPALERLDQRLSTVKVSPPAMGATP